MVMIAQSDKSTGVKNRKIQSTRTLIITPNFEIDVEMSPLYSSALYLEHDTPVELYKVCINSPIRDKPVSP